MQEESTLSKVGKWILKTVWKLFLILAWGCMRLIEVLAGQLAILFKKILD